MKKGKAYIARDRVGIKPLYIIETDEILAFSSELKSLMASNLIKCCISKRAVYENIVFGSSVRHTLIDGIDMVAPGSYYELDISLFEIVKKLFWNPVEAMKKKKKVIFF